MSVTTLLDIQPSNYALRSYVVRSTVVSWHKKQRRSGSVVRTTRPF